MVLSTVIDTYAQSDVGSHPSVNYQYVFATPFPKQYQVADSVFFELAKTDTGNASRVIKYMQAAAMQTGDELTQLNFTRSLIRYRYMRQYYSQDSASIKNLVSDAEALLKSVDEKKYPVIAALVHTTLGNTLNYKSYRYNDAFAHYLKAYNLYKNIPVQQYPDRQYSQYSIALAYYQFGDYENALKLGKEINSLYTEKNHTAVFIVDLIGMCNLRMENFTGSIPYFQWILDHYQKCGVSASWEGIALGNIGNALYLQGKNDEAIDYLKKAVTITIKGDVPDNSANFAALLSTIYLKQKNRPAAKLYVEIALDEAYKSNDISNYQIVYAALASYYKETGNAQKALLYQDSAIVYKDSLQKKNDVRLKHRAEMAVETERLMRQQQIFEAESSRNILIRNVSILFAALLILIIVLVFNSRRSKFKYEKQKMHIQQQLAETELNTAKEQLNSFTKSIIEKNELIDKAKAEILRITNDFDQLQNKQQATGTSGVADDGELKHLYESVILTDFDWDNFTSLFDKVYPEFFIRLKQKFPQLSLSEKKFIALSKLKLDNKEMAAMLGVGTDAIRQNRSRLKKKLNLDEEIFLEEIIDQI
ncbi:MAG: tetratricopeptide repeat protein [Bacteroidota bacterium]